MRRVLTGALLAAMTAMPAMASPSGLWEIEMRDSRYQASLCGDGTQLCVELVWLGNGADSPENLPYLHTMLIDHARQDKPNRWRGELNIYGQKADGTITQVSEDQITVRGCVAVILCKSYQMFRMK